MRLRPEFSRINYWEVEEDPADNISLVGDGVSGEQEDSDDRDGENGTVAEVGSAERSDGKDECGRLNYSIKGKG